MESIDLSRLPVKGSHLAGVAGIVTIGVLMYQGMLQTEVGVGIITSILVGLGAYGQGRKQEQRRSEVSPETNR